MTDKDKAIVTARTGVRMSPEAIHKFVEAVCSRPFWLCGMGMIEGEFKKKSKADSIRPCKGGE